MYGIMFTLKDSKLPIWSYLRDKLTSKSEFMASLFACSFCTGFHAGWLTYILMNYSLFDYKTWHENIAYMLIYGFVSASFCYFFDNILVRLENANNT